jgi:hypothetical protein
MPNGALIPCFRIGLGLRRPRQHPPWTLVCKFGAVGQRFRVPCETQGKFAPERHGRESQLAAARPHTSNFKEQSEVMQVWQNKFTPEAGEILVWRVNVVVPRFFPKYRPTILSAVLLLSYLFNFTLSTTHVITVIDFLDIIHCPAFF